MALYRCSACGSPNVVIDTQKEGYDYLKGAIGTVLLGAGGAAAGINAKNKQVFKCPDCGLTLSESMSFEIKTLIDIGVSCPSARGDLKLGGVNVSWDYFTRKYKNIEKDNFNIIINESSENTSTSNSVVSPKAKGDSTNQEGDAQNQSIYNVAKYNYIKARNIWVEECKNAQNKENEKNALRISKLEEETNRSIKQAEDKLQSKIKAITAQKKKYQEDIKDSETYLKTLGFFAFQEKKDTKNKITNLAKLVEDATIKITDLECGFDKKIQEIQEEFIKSKENIQKNTAKVVLPPRPEKPHGLFAFSDNGNKKSGQQLLEFHLQEEIFRFIEKQGTVTTQEIMDGPMADFTFARTTNFINVLIEDHEILKVSDGKYSVLYREISKHLLPKITDVDIAIYEQYMSEINAKKAEETKKSDDIKAIIQSVMVGKGPMTIEEIKDASKELSKVPNPKILVLLSKLSEEGVVTKSEKMRIRYFEWK